MKGSKRPYALRVDETLFEKLKFIATRNHRSINAQIEALIENCVDAYESENDIIDVHYSE